MAEEFVDEGADLPDSEDARLTATSRTATSEACTRLRTALRAVQGSRKPLVEWHGGQQGANGVFQMPFPVYHPAVDRLLEALYQVHTVNANFDWMHWVGGRQYPLASDVLSAPVADAVRLITAIVRGERFCDGTIAAALEDGRLLAAVQRVSDHACAGREITSRGAQSAASDELPPEHFIAVPPEPTPEEVRDIAGQLFDALQQDRAEHVHKMGAEGN